MLFRQNIKPRKFEYHPLVYDPAKEDQEDQEDKRRIRFPRHYVFRKKSRGQLWLVLLLILVLLMAYYWGSFQKHVSAKKANIKGIEVVK
ncbi:hypothetical protein BMS3Abin05_00900 [bacterium BMS3Abin05]|nr:hypothetical protein BMS3Abin05_00900 [bacterium BMS3Abin05]GBE27317.1 hypothetical protein BMS3Bbin03_01241 [bacterium BMS3Bbin03]HDZ12266.1 hypothetical protein [Bacteroidota bacterium]